MKKQKENSNIVVTFCQINRKNKKRKNLLNFLSPCLNFVEDILEK